MTDLSDLSLISIAPPSIAGDANIQAMAEALQPELDGVTNAILATEIYSRIDELPEPILKMLAWENRVYGDEWALATTLQAKRDLVKDSFLLNTRRGTRWSIERIFTLLDIDATIEEWFEFGGDPYTFRVVINSIAGGGVSGDQLDTANRMIATYKPLRCHIAYIQATLEADDVSAYAGAGITMNGVLDVFATEVPEGLTWSAMPRGLGSGQTSLADFTSIDTSGGGTWIVVGWEGISVISEDDGVSWDTINIPLSVGVYQARYLSADNSGGWVVVDGNGYYTRSTNDGASWSSPEEVIDVPGSTVAFFAVANNGGTWIATGAGGRAARSTDVGATWSELTPGLNSGSSGEDFRSVCGRNGTWVAVGSSGYAARSTDDGVTWSALTKGLNSGSSSADFRSVSTDGSGTWIAVGVIGYCSISTDDGVTWTALTKGLNSGYSSASFFSVVTNGNGTWIAIANNNGYCSISLDNGATWEAMTKGLNSGSSSADFTSASTDGSGTWMAVAENGFAAIGQ